MSLCVKDGLDLLAWGTASTAQALSLSPWLSSSGNYLPALRGFSALTGEPFKV